MNPEQELPIEVYPDANTGRVLVRKSDWSIVYLPPEAAPLFVQGLRVAGYAASEYQLTDQHLGDLVLALAPDDPLKQAAVGGYLTLLAMVVKRPERWSIVPAELDEVIARHGASWYAWVLESAERQERTGAADEQVWAAVEERKRAAGAGARNLPLIQITEEHELPPNLRKADTYVVTAELAARSASTLRQNGYAVNADQLAGRLATDIAFSLEPADPFRRRIVVHTLYLRARMDHRARIRQALVKEDMRARAEKRRSEDQA